MQQAEDVIKEGTHRAQKFYALWHARTLLAKKGAMEERRICATQLKKMKVQLDKGEI